MILFAKTPMAEAFCFIAIKAISARKEHVWLMSQIPDVAWVKYATFKIKNAESVWTTDKIQGAWILLHSVSEKLNVGNV